MLLLSRGMGCCCLVVTGVWLSGGWCHCSAPLGHLALGPKNCILRKLLVNIRVLSSWVLMFYRYRGFGISVLGRGGAPEQAPCERGAKVLVLLLYNNICLHLGKLLLYGCWWPAS